MSDQSQGAGWWLASDGKWYPPEQAPGAMPPPPPTTAMPPSVESLARRENSESGWSKARIVAMIACAALVVGAFMPWATFGPFTKAGVEDGGDGIVTAAVGFGVAAIVWVNRSGLLVLAQVLCVGALALAIWDTYDIGSEELISVGSGLILTLAAAVVAFFAANRAWQAQRGGPSSDLHLSGVYHHDD